MKFTANAAGTITELRYFRGAADAGDTDTRVLNLGAPTAPCSAP